MWISSQNGASVAQFLAKIIDVLPAPSKVDGLEYMEAAEAIPKTPDIASFLDISDDRYSKTDDGESWHCLAAFTEFAKTPNESYK